jgi:hypothetical protein
MRHAAAKVWQQGSAASAVHWMGKIKPNPTPANRRNAHFEADVL